MGLLGDKRLWALLAGIAATLVAFVGVAVVGFLRIVSAATSPANANEPLLHVLVDAALPYVVLSLVLGVVGVVLAVALVWVVVANIDAGSDRVQSLVERAEREYGVLGMVGLADRLPSESDSGSHNTSG